MVRPTVLGFGLLLVACGGRFAGDENPGDAGSVDSESVVDANQVNDASETPDRIAPEASSEAESEANTQDAPNSVCPSGEATCPDVDLCMTQIAASPPAGVVADDASQAVDDIRRLGDETSLSDFRAGKGEFVGTDGHPYAFVQLPNCVWLIADDDATPAVYELVVRYIQCGYARPLGNCDMPDAGATD